MHREEGFDMEMESECVSYFGFGKEEKSAGIFGLEDQFFKGF